MTGSFIGMDADSKTHRQTCVDDIVLCDGIWENPTNYSIKMEILLKF